VIFSGALSGLMLVEGVIWMKYLRRKAHRRWMHVTMCVPSTFAVKISWIHVTRAAG